MNNDFNHELRIHLVDRQGDLIQMISQRQAGRLLEHDFCILLLQKPLAIQYIQDQKWNVNYLNRHPKWFTEKNKKVIYGNFQLESPIGETMFHCGAKKALWYLNRDLVDIISINPAVLRFKFEPKGAGHIGDDYYLSSKINKCVVCGRTDNLSRHHIVPVVFRKHLPEEIKCHSYHDILPLCIDCHRQYEIYAYDYKKELASSYGITLHAGTETVYDVKVARPCKAAHALYNYKIPLDKKIKLEAIVKDFLQKDFLTEEDLQYCANLKVHHVHGEPSYGKYITERLPDIQQFVEQWRKHFFEKMQPKFMPKHWDFLKSIYK